jgi:hypothetical protein
VALALKGEASDNNSAMVVAWTFAEKGSGARPPSEGPIASLWTKSKAFGVKEGALLSLSGKPCETWFGRR